MRAEGERAFVSHIYGRKFHPVVAEYIPTTFSPKRLRRGYEAAYKGLSLPSNHIKQLVHNAMVQDAVRGVRNHENPEQITTLLVAANATPREMRTILGRSLQDAGSLEGPDSVYKRDFQRLFDSPFGQEKRQRARRPMQKALGWINRPLFLRFYNSRLTTKDLEDFPTPIKRLQEARRLAYQVIVKPKDLRKIAALLRHDNVGAIKAAKIFIPALKQTLLAAEIKHFESLASKLTGDLLLAQASLKTRTFLRDELRYYRHLIQAPGRDLHAFLTSRPEAMRRIWNSRHPVPIIAAYSTTFDAGKKRYSLKARRDAEEQIFDAMRKYAVDPFEVASLIQIAGIGHEEVPILMLQVLELARNGRKMLAEQADRQSVHDPGKTREYIHHMRYVLQYEADIIGLQQGKTDFFGKHDRIQKGASTTAKPKTLRRMV